VTRPGIEPGIVP